MTSNEPSADRWERLRPRNWSLAFKLISVLIVPVLLAQALLVLRIVEQVNAADRLGLNERYVLAQDRFSKLGDELQGERDEAVRFVAGGRTGNRASLKTSAFDATDRAVSEALAATGDAASLPAVGEQYRLAQDALGKLATLRTQVTDLSASVDDVVNQYTATLAPVLALETALARELKLAEPTNLPTTLESLDTAREQITLQHAIIAGAIIRKAMSPQAADLVRATEVRLATNVGELNTALDAGQRARYTGFLATPDNARRDQVRNVVLTRLASTAAEPGTNGATTAPPVLPAAAEWDAAVRGVLTGLGSAEDGARDDLRALNTAQQENARNLAGIYSVVLLLATVLGTTLLVLVWRTLLKSLRTLRGTALDVAQRKLPQALQSMRDGEVPDIVVEPVPVTTREEIGQVARAFDAVHSQAVRLAAEQATLQAGVSSMFVNLSRRSQGLVERQLQLIEQLESNEQDPDQLANLFQLDHLATRMRRNSESLLVLAGSEANRRSGQPVPVIDVLRAAVSEVEQYQRIVVQPPPPVKILGRTAADLVHLLAELLDNATNFSAPDTQVVMSSTRTEDGSVLIEIADRGVGMAPNELAEANDRLSGPTTVDVSASRRMGLFVVGRLASRHGIGVRLGGPPVGTAAGGVTASVSVPSYLVPLAEGAGTAAGDGARVGASAAMAGEQLAGNGASSAASLQSLVAGGNSRSVPSGAANGHSGAVPPELPPQRTPMDRPLTESRLGPPLAPPQSPQGASQGRPQGLSQPPPHVEQSGPDHGRASIETGQWNGPAGPATPTTGQVTETAPPRAHAPGLEQNPTGGQQQQRGGQPPNEPSAFTPLRNALGGGMRSGSETAAPPAQHPQPQGAPGRSTSISGSAMFAPSVPATAEPPAADPLAADPLAAESPAAAAPAPPPAPPVAPPPLQPPTSPPPPPTQHAVPRRPPVDPALTERRDLSETTPIFEEIASAWFQSNRPVPVDWDAAAAEVGSETGRQQDHVANQQVAAGGAAPTHETRSERVEQADTETETGADTPPEPQQSKDSPSSTQRPMLDPKLRVTSSLRSAWPEPTAERPEAEGAEHADAPAAATESVPQSVADPEPEVVERRPSETEPESAPVAHDAPLRVPAQPAASLPTRRPAAALHPPPEQAPAEAVPEPAAAAPSSLEFANAADAGWQAAQALDSSADNEPDELTPAGLPKRKPRARLVPGSAGSPAVTPTPAGTPPRTADAVRGRLASYQEGVRQGREQRRRREPDPAGATTGGRQSDGHDEENR